MTEPFRSQVVVGVSRKFFLLRLWVLRARVCYFRFPFNCVRFWFGNFASPSPSFHLKASSERLCTCPFTCGGLKVSEKKQRKESSLTMFLLIMSLSLKLFILTHLKDYYDFYNNLKWNQIYSHYCSQYFFIGTVARICWYAILITVL